MAMAFAAAADWRARVYTELKRHRPALVVVTFDDGESKSFKASGGERGRWTRLLEALPAEWARVELQDREENVLWGLDAPREGGTAAPKMLGSGGTVDMVSQLVKIMLAAQDTALARQGETLSKMQASYETLTKTLTERLTSLEGLVSTMMQSVYEATLATAEVQGMLNTNGGQESQGQAMLMKLLKLKGMDFDGPRRPNGHARKPTPPESAPSP
jgi:hypothetical protein